MRLRHLAVAFLVALALGIVVDRTTTTNAVQNPMCVNLTPDDTFLWWWFECGKDAGGGGGSGAGD